MGKAWARSVRYSSTGITTHPGACGKSCATAVVAGIKRAATRYIKKSAAAYLRRCKPSDMFDLLIEAPLICLPEERAAREFLQEKVVLRWEPGGARCIGKPLYGSQVFLCVSVSLW